MRFFNLFLFSLLAVISLSAPNAVAENESETATEGSVLANGCRRVCVPRRCWTFWGRRTCYGGQCHNICPPKPKPRRCLQYRNVCTGGGRKCTPGGRRCVGGRRVCHGWGPFRRCFNTPRHCFNLPQKCVTVPRKCNRVCIRWGAANAGANTDVQEEETNQTEEQTAGVEGEAADPVAAETPAEGSVLANGCRRVCVPRRCWTFWGRRTCYGGQCHNICPPKPKPRRCLQYRNVCTGGGRKCTPGGRRCVGGRRVCHGWGPWRRCFNTPRHCFNLPQKCVTVPRKCNRVCIRWGAANAADEEEEETIDEEIMDEESAAGVENENGTNQYVIGGAMISGVGLLGGVATYLFKTRNIGSVEELEALQV